MSLVALAACVSCASAVASNSMPVLSGKTVLPAPTSISGIIMRLRGGADFTEKVTGISFSDTLSAAGKSLKFVGAGERRKAILGPVAVNVYAIGLYVDAAAAKMAGVTVIDDETAAYALSKGTFTKSLRLVMARSVGGEKIGDALAEQIIPRVKGTDAPVDGFKSFFKSIEMLENKNEVIFTQTGSTLTVKSPVATKDFVSADLCSAMFDIYLGDKPVSENAKKSMVAGFRGMLK
jgi:hypothetical protein